MRLLNLPPEEIPEYLAGLRGETKAILTQIDEIGFYSRSISRDEAFRMTRIERENFMKLAQSNIERTSKTGIALL